MASTDTEETRRMDALYAALRLHEANVKTFEGTKEPWILASADLIKDAQAIEEFLRGSDRPAGT